MAGKQNEHNLEILNCIYKNCRMAAESIETVNKSCEDDELRHYITDQFVKYDESCKRVSSEIQQMGGTPEEPPKTQSMMANMGINMKKMADNSRQNLAKMMYNGTNMGIVDISRVVNRATDADREIVNEARSLLDTEEAYASGLKDFL